jgi:F0F1-type ATP synthase epsilon subunit
MADGVFKLKIFSGRGLEIESTVTSVAVPTESGEIGVLADHCDYVGLLGTGLVSFTVPAKSASPNAAAGEGATKRCLVSGGLCTFNQNVLTLLADTVDNPEALDTTPLNQDISLLKTQLETLSLFDPEWEALSQKVARIEALRVLASEAGK